MRYNFYHNWEWDLNKKNCLLLFGKQVLEIIQKRLLIVVYYIVCAYEGKKDMFNILHVGFPDWFMKEWNPVKLLIYAVTFVKIVQIIT